MKKNKGRAPSFLKILRKSSFFSHYLTLMIICNLAVYIPFSCISYFAMQNMTQGNINTVATQNMYEFKTSFDKINTEIMGIYNSIVSNEEINSALNSGTVQNSIARNLKNYIILDPCISAVEYFDIEHSHLYSTMVSGGEEKIEGSPWYAAYKEGHKNFVTSYTEKFANREEHYIIIFREVWANYNRMSGGVVFYINMVNYESQVLVPAIGNQKYFYIADNEGMILYSNKYETIGTKQTEETAEKKKVIEDSDIYLSKNGNIVDVSTSSSNDIYTLGLKFNVKEYTKNLRAVKVAILVTTFFLLCMSIFLAVIVAVSMYKRIFNVVKVFNDTTAKVAGSDIFETDSQQKINEVDYLLNNIMAVHKRKDEIEDELAKQVIKLKYYRNAALRMQINPHFIFNTLHQINIMLFAKEGGDSRITDMISMLSQLIRLSLDMADIKVSISKEWEYSLLFVELQKMKYNERLKVNCSVDDSALKCMCLPITIQPLIENAVQHGMRKSMTVDIIVKHIQDKIVIEVSDNGIGITPERLAEIRSRLDNPDELRTKNLGMSNINSRYLLLYGDAYTLTIQSVPNEKTTVRIEIPAENA